MDGNGYYPKSSFCSQVFKGSHTCQCAAEIDIQNHRIVQVGKTLKIIESNSNPTILP